MPAVNVTAEIEIAAEPTDVASVMFDPGREPEWMSAVKTVDLVDKGIKPGARVRRTGTFVGQDIAWTTAVESFHFPHALTLKVVDGPFPAPCRPPCSDRDGIGCANHESRRDHGTRFLPASMIEHGMRTMLAADLGRLKAIVEKKQ